MKISFIIATYNVENSLEVTLKSIICQDNLNYEIIVIDGKSTDNTQEVVEKYQENIHFFSSEKDNGIYDAWNKGLAKSNGDWIMFVGAGDYYLDGIFDKIVPKLYKTTANMITTDINIIDSNSVILKHLSSKMEKDIFVKYMNIPHPGILHRKSIFENLGNFNTNFRIAGDYEFILRNLYWLNFEHLQLVSLNMVEGGISNSVNVFFENYKIKIEVLNANKFVELIHLTKNLFLFYLRKLYVKF